MECKGASDYLLLVDKSLKIIILFKTNIFLLMRLVK